MKKNKGILIEWEEKDLKKEKEPGKIKKFFNYILSKLSIISGILEATIVLIISIKIKDNNTYWLIPLALSILLYWLAIKKIYNIWKSKKIIIYEENNKRVIGMEGPPGSGKTSLMFLVSSIMKRPVFTSAPAKINGEYTYKLTKEITSVNCRIPYGSMLDIDEITLYYNNNNANKYNDEIEGLEMQMQLLRHFYDGNIQTASVEMDRLLKRLEEKHGMFRHLLGQESINNSFIIDPIIKLISYIFNLQVKTGIRKWTYQTFEQINHKGYIFDLSNQEANTKTKQFSNLVEITAYNSSLNFEYNDRYFKDLYLDLPKANIQKWEALNFDFKDLEETGFKDITNFFKKKYEKINKGDNNENEYN